MWVKKYSRIFLQFLLIIVFGGAAFLGIRNGQRWVPPAAFVVYLIASIIILPRFPSPMPQQVTLRGALDFTAWVIRLMGGVAALGAIAALVSYPFLSNPLPLWAMAIVLFMWATWACICLWVGHWISKKASTTDPSKILGLASTNRDRGKS